MREILFVVGEASGDLHAGKVAEAIRAQRSRKPGHAGILRRMRHASGHAAAGPACRDPQGRHARRSKPVRLTEDGDLYDRQAAVPPRPGRYPACLDGANESSQRGPERVRNICARQNSGLVQPGTERQRKNDCAAVYGCFL